MKTPQAKKVSGKQEKGIAKIIKGKTQIGSGCTPFYKGDVSNRQILIEAKTKMSKCASFSINRKWLEDLKRQSLSMHRNFCALAIAFGPGEKNYYVIDENLFKTLVTLMEEQNNGTK